jgi:hydroxyacylglutathione hydrolase
MMHIEQFFLDGLGHQSYLIADSQGGAVIDPRRDVDVYLAAVQRMGAHITHILETHIHNDYVTGARELAARTGATIVASADAHLAYGHQPVRDGEQVQIGDLRFETLATPGHTPEHVSYALYEPGSVDPYAIFSGGSLLVGGSGRTDLLGAAMTLTLTRQQYHSLRRLLGMLPGQVLVYPTHGAGSFCGASTISPTRYTTIAQERMTNPAAYAQDEEEFVRRQIAAYGTYPRYYGSMRDVNQQGPRILGGIPQPSALAPQGVRARMAAGTPLVDGRARDAFARAHVPGSLNIELDSSFSTYVGWILPFNVPLLLLIEDADGRHEAVVQLMRIGYEQIEGYLEGGIAFWQAAGLPVGHFERIDVAELHARWARHEPLTVVDVRRDDEWRTGHIPGALHLHIGELAQHLDELPRDRPVATICASGYRAETAASMVAATGRRVIAVQGGVPEWIARGLPATADEAAAPTRAPGDITHAHL